MSTGLRRETTERQQTEEALAGVAARYRAGEIERVSTFWSCRRARMPTPPGDALPPRCDWQAQITVSQVALPAEAWDRRASGDPDRPADRGRNHRRWRAASRLFFRAASNDALASFRDRGLLTGDTPLPGGVHYVVLVGGETNAASVSGPERAGCTGRDSGRIPQKADRGAPKPRPTPSRLTTR